MKSRLPQGYGTSRNDIMKQYAKVQELLQQKTKQIEETTFKSSSGGGVVELSINGKKEVLSLNIKPEILDPDDIEMLQDLIVSALNDAFKQVDDITEKEMGQITSGLPMNGLF